MTGQTRRRVALVLLVALVAASGAGTAGQGDGPDSVPAGQVDVPRDDVLLDVAVRPDGAADVQVEIRTDLDTEARREAFEAERQRIREERLTVAGTFAEQMRSVARLAERNAGREMAIRNVTVGTAVLGVQGRRGVVVFRFRWDGFAGVQPGGRMTAGPALSTMPLAENTSLQLRWPDDYRRVDASPEPDAREAGRVSWEGPAEFGSDQPRVVVEPGGGIRPTRGVPDWLFAVAGLLAAGLVAGVVRRRRRGSAASGATPDADDEAESTEEGPPPELLSDRERVLALVEDEGGRMKQQDVVEAMDWSETKTSDVVAELREDGALEVYRIGRENVLALPGEMDV